MATTKEELIGRARELAPGIAARASEAEALRKPHDDSIRDLVDAELMSLLTPRRWGGHELDLMTHLEVTEIISAACMSTGWIAAFYLGHNWFVSKLPERAQAEIFADRPFGLIPATSQPTFGAMPVPGGWEVTGRASWGSGIMHADWAVVGGVTDEKEPRVFLVPVSDVTVDDVWHMSAMSGTGSNDIVLEKTFVPEHRSMRTEEFFVGRSEGSSIHENPLYQIPLMPFIYCEIFGVFSGGITGAAQAFQEIVGARVTTHAQSVLKEKQHSHVVLGDVDARTQVARDLARLHVRETETLAEAGVFTTADRLRLKARTGFVVDHCRDTVNDMIRRAGSSSFHSGQPLQRFFRDLNMLATHAFLEWDSASELWGRHLLGLEPNQPLI